MGNPTDESITKGTPAEPKKKQVQPKTHAGKSRQVAAKRREKIIKSIIAGDTQIEAGIKAGLSPKTAQQQVSNILLEPCVRVTFQELLHKAVPDEYQAKKYREVMEATKVISVNVIAKSGEGMADANSMTKDFIDVPDYPTQLRANDSISKLKGYLDDKETITGPVNIMIVYDKKDRLGMEDA